MKKITKEEIESAQAYENFLVPALFEKWPSIILDSVILKPGDKILDVACGTGILAREASKRVKPEGSATGLDASPGMLTVAKQIDPDVNWVRGQAEMLPFPDESFDVVVSQFGLMFFSDKIKSIREMLRVLVPGGKLAVAVWHDLDHSVPYKIEVELLERMAGSNAANALRAPFVLGDKNELKKLFTDAGVNHIEIRTHNVTANFPEIRSMIEADLRGWLPVMGVVLSDELIEKILNEAETALKQFKNEDGKVSFDSPGHIVTITN